MKYNVTIEEHVSEMFPIEADSLEEAMEIAEKQYNDGVLVVNSDSVTARLMMGRNRGL